ncbi:MAG: amino acid adenylation domain-containing protein [Cyanobacteria bacterium P01_F01_bin.53]
MSTVQDLYELSPMQQGMLFHSLYAPETGVYFEQRHCLLEGSLDSQAFRQAWQQVCDRYDTLRSEFHWEETDKPLQVVYETLELPWIEEDWTEFSPTQQNEKLEAFLIAERLQGFQLDRGPLMRCGLLRLGDSQYRFVWNYHHLLMDGWCNGVLIKEVLTIYQAKLQGQRCALLPVKPYREYIVWLQKQNKESAEAYWRDVLKGFESPTPLGIDRVQTDNSNIEEFDIHQEEKYFLSRALSKDLQTFASQSRLTLNTLLQGAWAIVLGRYSGLEDVLFGVTVSGRPPALAGVSAMVGLFINTVPLRAQLSPTDPLLPWLQELQQAQRDRETYSYSLLADVQSWSDIPSGAPLFESLLVFENYPISIEAATSSLETGISLRDGQGYEQTNYPLTLVVIPGESIQLSLRYDAQRISETLSARLLGHLEVALRSFVEAPEQTLGNIPVLTAAEQLQLDEMGQGQVIEVPPDCVHQQFEKKATETPNSIAISFSAGLELDTLSTLSYQQLNQQSNKIAQSLKRQGVIAGNRVGLCLDRSVDMVASLLAILKLGATYVPIDPSHPAQRSNYIVENAQIEHLITTNTIAEQSTLKTTALLFCLDEQRDLIAQQSGENLPPVATSNDTAYILYTSGSTGQPKGVPIRHYSLTNFLTSMAELSAITADDTLLAVTTLGFDIAALEIFLPLITGAHLVMIPRSTTLDGEQLAAQLTAHNVTLMQATPATWRLLLNAGWEGPELKMLCGGEALDFALAEQLLACGKELWNLYGPTETTIWSGALKIDEQILQQGSIPMGAPIANTQFYILDDQQRQVPMGVAGELCIGGAGLSEGYWNRPDLTAERFIAHPLTPSEILYKTGDRVRYREDGTFDYLGRLDNQIKLRGFRIELGEIQTRLGQHPNIEQAVVIVSDGDNPQLLAYVTLTDNESDEANYELTHELRQSLKQQLPAYMLPNSYIVLEDFPLTPNGKVDRHKLPVFSHKVSIKAPPSTPNETLTAEIWSDVLKVAQVSLNDNFFELGGHSLLATQVIAQVRQVFGTEVPLRALFEHPTLSDFVDAIQRQQARPQLEGTQFLPNIPRTDECVLSYAQQRQWLMTQLDPDSAAYNIPTAVRIKGKLSIQGLCQSLAQVVSRHDTLRTLYPTVEGIAVPTILTAEYPSAKHPSEGSLSRSPVHLEFIDLSYLDGKSQRSEITQTIQQQAQNPFDLAQGPLWRSHLLRLSDREHILLFILHHIVADGWSMGVLIKELTAFYTAHQAGKDLADVLPPLPVRYGDYAAWQRTLDLSHQLTYWKKQLSGIAPILALPTDYARPAEPASTGASYEFRLSRSETEALKQFSQRHKVTLFMTLLAAFKALLYRYSGLSDLAIGTPIANRQRKELEGLIGLFVNTLVIRTQVQNNPRFSDFLTQVRSVTLEAYSHQDLPFEQLIDALDIQRSRSQSPLVQVMFALQNAPHEGTSLSGSLAGIDGKELSWEPLGIDSGTAKFDLTLDIKESERGMIGQWEYRSDLFSAETIHRMAGHFRTILRALPNNGDLRLSALPMLSSQEVKQFQAWSKNSSEQPLPHENIQQLFETQASETPDTIALVYKNTQTTYQTLNQKANQLAHYLRKQGVSLETPVGVWAMRSPATLIAILAILKAGGTYIPLDPHYPLERLEWMVADTQMALLISEAPEKTSEKTSGKDSEETVPSAIKAIVPTVELGEISQQLSSFPATQLSSPTAVTPTSLAYILYTSGSTGRPKGVCVSHQSVTRLVKAPNYVTLTQRDVILQAAPLTFDASTFEIWGALLNGGKLVLLPTQTPSLDELGKAISQHQITTLWLTSGLFNLMVDEQLTSLTGVRKLLAGGDVLSRSHLRKALTALTNTRIINGYGPTEGTTFTCCHTVTKQDLDSMVPIGQPLQHTQIYVLDADLQQAPAGIPGELYIGGAGVARGYLNQPQLTAERFIPNPFYDIRQRSDSDSLYLYKTGDRVRYRTDGALEYLGRLDHQVKIRGFRIEPGEIAAALESHPAIQQVAVVVDGESAEQKRLVAYLETAEEASAPESVESPVTTLDLRRFLLGKLPDYMVPAQFIWIEALPLTANGKVDRKALPAPEWKMKQASEGNGSPQNRPQSMVEETLVDIFSALLPAESVGIHDNFFELGGDSILAMQIVSKASQAGLAISPKQLFQYQTIAELSAVTEQGKSTALSQEPSTGKAPLTPIQHWFFEQALAEPQHFNQSVRLELPDGFNQEALEVAIAHLYAHHDALRLRFHRTDDGWQQAYSEDMTPPVVKGFEFSQLPSDQQDSAIAQQIDILQSSFDLQAGPLVSIGVFELGSTRPAQLFIAIHHLIVDGVSWRILLADLQQAYQQVIAGEAIRLSPKTHSYQQWAQELEKVANSPEIEADFDYWIELLHRKNVNTIPLENSGSYKETEDKRENTIGHSQTVVVSLSLALTQALLREVPPVYNTQITETLLTAFTQTLTQWTGETSVLIDLESYGRFSEELDLSRSVGWFTAIYPVVLSFDAPHALADSIKAIKSNLRAVPHQGLSYGLLRHMSKRYLDQSPSLAIIPPVSFNYLGQLDAIEKGGFKRVVSAKHSTKHSTNQSAKNARQHLIDVNSWIEADQLQIEWIFSRDYHTRETIGQLAEQFISNLSAIIEHCCKQEVADYTSDDFGLVQLDASALSAVLSQVSFADEGNNPEQDSKEQDSKEQDSKEQEVKQ